MGLDSRRRLAVDSMVELALRARAGPVPLASIAHYRHVSVSGLELVFARLRACALVQSTRGPGGGYTLARPATEISVADIVDAADAGSTGVEEGDTRLSATREMARRVDAAMHVHMAGVALAELMAVQLEAGAVVEQRPYRRPSSRVPQPRQVAERVPNSVFDLGSAMARSAARASGR